MNPFAGEKVQTTETRILDVSKMLARAIGESTQLQKYEKATENMQANPEAKRRLSEFREAQQKLQMVKQWGGASEKDFTHLEKLQEQLLSNPDLKKYFQAQENLVSMLKELNVLISEKLGYDFANLAKPSIGCCS